MTDVSNRLVRALESRDSALFLVAGALLVVYGAFNGIDAFTASAYPAVEDAFGTTGFVLGFLGLLGLFPKLVARSPRLARFGAGCAALGAAGFSVFAVASLGRIAGVLPEQQPSWAVVFLVMAALGMVPGYLSTGVASLRTGVLPRRVGLLLLTPAAIFAAMVTGGLTGYTPQWSAFLISSGQAIALLATGYTLRVGCLSTNHEMPAGDATAG